MTSRRFVTTATLATMLVLFSATDGLAETPGIGAFPDHVEFTNALRGGSHEATVGIVNDGDVPLRVNAAIRGDVAPWIDIANATGEVIIDEFTIGTREREFTTLHVRIPGDAANGSYGAELVLKTAGGTGGGPVTLGISIPISVQVTGTQVIDGALRSVDVEDTEVGVPAHLGAVLNYRGNVLAVPVLHVVVTSAGETIDAFDLRFDPVPEGEVELTGTWTPTTASGPTEFSVSAALQGVEVGAATARATVYPRGHFTRSIEVAGSDRMNDPPPGGVAQLDLIVANTGEIEAVPVFLGELTREGVVVGQVESLPVRLRPGETGRLVLYLDVPTSGVFHLRGDVYLDEAPVVRVEEELSIGDASDSVFPLGVVVTIVAAAAFVAAFLTARARQRPEPSSIAQDGSTGVTS